MHRIPTRNTQSPTPMNHLHTIHPLPHIQTRRLLQRPQIPPPHDPIFSSRDADDPVLTLVPDEGTDVAFGGGIVGVGAAEDEGLGVGTAEVEEPDFLLVAALEDCIEKLVSIS